MALDERPRPNLLLSTSQGTCATFLFANMQPQKHSSGLSLFFFLFLFSNTSSVLVFCRAFGRLDILVNNAAGNFMCAADNLTPKGFKTVLDIDLQGSFHMCKAMFPYLKLKKPHSHQSGNVFRTETFSVSSSSSSSPFSFPFSSSFADTLFLQV